MSVHLGSESNNLNCLLIVRFPVGLVTTGLVTTGLETFTSTRVAKNSVQPPKVPPVQPPNPSPEVLLSAPLVKRKCWLLDLG